MARQRATRGRPSRIEQLPPGIKDALDGLLRSGLTQREILRRLNPDVEADGLPPLSKSGLQRYSSSIAEALAEAGAEIRQTRAVADALVAKFGEEPTGEVGQLTVEILRTLAVRAAVRARQMSMEEDVDLKDVTGLINQLSLSIERLERAADTSAKREQRMREALAVEAADRAAQAAETAARESGHALPVAVLERIRRDVYGIRDAA